MKKEEFAFIGRAIFEKLNKDIPDNIAVTLKTQDGLELGIDFTMIHLYLIEDSTVKLNGVDNKELKDELIGYLKSKNKEYNNMAINYLKSYPEVEDQI